MKQKLQPSALRNAADVGSRPTDLWRRRRGALISRQRRLQVDDISLFFSQLPVSLDQHGVHFLPSQPP